MSKGSSLGIGLGLISILLAVGYVGMMEKSDVQQADPSIAAGLRAENTANLANLSMVSNLYTQEKGKAPQNVDDLVPKYLNVMPQEAFSKSNAVVSTYDGTGGWVLNDSGFSPNFPQDLQHPTPVPAH